MSVLLFGGEWGEHSDDEGFKGGDKDTRSVPLEGDFVLTVHCFAGENEVGLAEFGSVKDSCAIVCVDSP